MYTRKCSKDCTLCPKQKGEKKKQKSRKERKQRKKEEKMRKWAKRNGIKWSPNFLIPKPPVSRKKSKKPEWKYPYWTEEGRIERGWDKGDVY